MSLFEAGPVIYLMSSWQKVPPLSCDAESIGAFGLQLLPERVFTLSIKGPDDRMHSVSDPLTQRAQALLSWVFRQSSVAYAVVQLGLIAGGQLLDLQRCGEEKTWLVLYGEDARRLCGFDVSSALLGDSALLEQYELSTIDGWEAYLQELAREQGARFAAVQEEAMAASVFAEQGVEGLRAVFPNVEMRTLLSG